MIKGSIRFTQWSGGLAPYPDRGPAGSFLYGRNLDIRNSDGALKLNSRAEVETDSAVNNITEFITNGFIGTDGKLYAFGDQAGLYIRDENKDWVKEATISHGAIIGSAEFEMNNGSDVYVSHIVGATTTKLYAEGFDEGFGTLEEKGTFERGAGYPHRVVQALGVILVTDGDYIALLDREEAFNATALRLPTGFIAQDIKEDGNIVRILGKTHDDRAKEFTWDTVQTSWLTQKDIQMQGVNSADYFETGLLLEGNKELKYYDGANLEPLIRLPGETGVNARTLKDNLLHMGVWDAGDKSGIYSYGRRDFYSPLALNLEYQLTNSSPDEIGLVVVHKGDLIATWKNGSNYGVDIVRDTNDKDTGVYESLQRDDNKPKLNKFFTRATVFTDEIDPDDTGIDIDFFYMTNRNRQWTRMNMADGVDEINAGDLDSNQMRTKWIFSIQDKGEWIAIRMVIDGDDNTSPVIHEVIVDYHATRAE